MQDVAGGISEFNEFTRAMHHRTYLSIVAAAAAYLEVTSTRLALDNKPVEFHGERMEEEDAVECCSRTRRSAYQLQISGARKDDATVNHVVGDEGMQRV